MKSVLALDRYTNKYLNINKVSPEILENLKVGDKIVYEQPDPKTGAMKLSIWTIISWGVRSGDKDKNFFSADFVRMLEGKEEEEFKNADEIVTKAEEKAEVKEIIDKVEEKINGEWTKNEKPKRTVKKPTSRKKA